MYASIKSCGKSFWRTCYNSDVDSHHLRAFAAVFKKRSFSKASEELLLSQPTVSDHIKWYIAGEFHGKYEHLNTDGRMGKIIGRPNGADLQEICEKVIGVLKV